MKINKNVLIVCSETNLNLEKFSDFYKIGVERGCLDLINKQITPDLSISDFDNVLNEELALIKSKSKKTEILSKEKDLIDGELAIISALKLGAENIIYIVKPSKRYDMNLTILYLVNKYKIKIINEESCIFALKKGINEINFNNYQEYTYISFFSILDNVISISDMKYNAKNLKLTSMSIKAISNSFVLYKNPIIECQNELVIIMTK